MRKKRGQSTLEYLLVVAGVLVAVIAGVNVLKGKVDTNMTNAGTALDNAGTKLTTSLNTGGVTPPAPGP